MRSSLLTAEMKMTGREVMPRAVWRDADICKLRRGSVGLTRWPSCGSMRGMSITVELPPDLEQQVKDIPDMGQRVISFLRDQVE